MWQRARIVRAGRPGNPPVGMLLWVEARAPEVPPGVTGVVDSPTGRPIAAVPGYRTNLMQPPMYDRSRFLPETWVVAEMVELLARGLEDFCDDPPRIPWGAWKDQAPD